MPNLVGTSLNQVPTNSMLGGLAYQDPDHASIKDLDLKNLSQINSEIADTATDVFVYDTRKDSDGGAWRKRTQNTSWYNETLGTATRGTRKEFPAVAVIVAESNKVKIYDGDDPDLPMWMVFNNAGTTLANMSILGRAVDTNTCVEMLNGVLFVGNSNYFATRIPFISENVTDFVGQFASTTGPLRYNGNISQRNAGLGKTKIGSGTPILTAAVNDVAMTVLPNAPIDDATGLPIPTIAVATSGGVSVVKDDESVVNYTFSNGLFTSIDWFSNTKLLAGTSHISGTIGFKQIVINFPAMTAEITLGFGHSGFPNWTTGLASGAGNAVDKFITNKAGNFSIGYNGVGGYTGVNLINYLSASRNSVAYITTDYNSGYMPGDIKGALLSDTDTTNLDGTNLITNGTFDSDTTGWSAGNGATLTQQSNGNPGGNLNVASDGVSNGYANQSNTVVVGKYYIVSFDHYHASGSQEGYVNIGTSLGGSQYVYHNLGTSSSWTSHSFTIKATSTSLFIGLYSRPSGSGNVRYDNITLREADPDRSGNNNGLEAYGTITKSAVATGADLVSYSGFSATNNLVQPYNSDLNFGTGDFCFVAWIKKATLSTNHYVLDRNDGSGETDRFSFMINASGKLNLYSGSTNSSAESAANTFVGSSAWRMVLVKRVSGVITFGLDGKEYTSTTIAGNWSTTNLTGSGNENLFIGQYGGGGTPGNVAYNVDYGIGEIANVRLTASAPSAEQFKKMYDDEKYLYMENAKATLYGSSDAVIALAYDDTTDLLHVGTSAGRSEFQGLRRINNTTTAVTTAISASNGLVTEQ